MNKLTLIAVALTACLALAACAGQDTKSQAQLISDTCSAANAAKPFADAAAMLPQTSAKVKADIAAAENVLWPAPKFLPNGQPDPSQFSCTANPLPTSLDSAQIASLVIAGVTLAEAIRGH